MHIAHHNNKTKTKKIRKEAATRSCEVTKCFLVKTAPVENKRDNHRFSLRKTLKNFGEERKNVNIVAYGSDQMLWNSSAKQILLILRKKTFTQWDCLIKSS